MIEQDSKEKILVCIDRALSSLGDSSRQVIYWHLNILYDLRREDIPANPVKFKQCLKSMLGHSANSLEYMIIRDLKGTFQINDDVNGLEQMIRRIIARAQLNEIRLSSPRERSS